MSNEMTEDQKLILRAARLQGFVWRGQSKAGTNGMKLLCPADHSEYLFPGWDIADPPEDMPMFYDWDRFAPNPLKRPQDTLALLLLALADGVAVLKMENDISCVVADRITAANIGVALAEGRDVSALMRAITVACINALGRKRLQESVRGLNLVPAGMSAEEYLQQQRGEEQADDNGGRDPSVREA